MYTYGYGCFGRVDLKPELVKIKPCGSLSKLPGLTHRCDKFIQIQEKPCAENRETPKAICQNDPATISRTSSADMWR